MRKMSPFRAFPKGKLVKKHGFHFARKAVIVLFVGERALSGPATRVKVIEAERLTGQEAAAILCGPDNGGGHV
ncbi:hypothetical protein GCM10007285_03970 [Stappia taiwanensis]|nr:hypothetical protein GCM10007285_03970 [Stappia taiwanensis]